MSGGRVAPVYVTDREGDLYELYMAAEKRAESGLATASWLIRGQHNRILENEAHLLSEVENTKAWGEIELGATRPPLMPIYFPKRNDHLPQRHSVVAVFY